MVRDAVAGTSSRQAQDASLDLRKLVPITREYLQYLEPESMLSSGKTEGSVSHNGPAC